MNRKSYLLAMAAAALLALAPAYAQEKKDPDEQLIPKAPPAAAFESKVPAVIDPSAAHLKGMKIPEPGSPEAPFQVPSMSPEPLNGFAISDEGFEIVSLLMLPPGPVYAQMPSRPDGILAVGNRKFFLYDCALATAEVKIPKALITAPNAPKIFRTISCDGKLAPYKEETNLPDIVAAIKKELLTGKTQLKKPDYIGSIKFKTVAKLDGENRNVEVPAGTVKIEKKEYKIYFTIPPTIDEEKIKNAGDSPLVGPQGSSSPANMK